MRALELPSTTQSRMSKCTSKSYLFFNPVMSPLAFARNLLSVVFTTTSRNDSTESVPLNFVESQSGSLKFLSTGAKGWEMSVNKVVPVILLVEKRKGIPFFLLGNCTSALSNFRVVFAIQMTASLTWSFSAIFLNFRCKSVMCNPEALSLASHSVSVPQMLSLSA